MQSHCEKNSRVNRHLFAGENGAGTRGRRRKARRGLVLGFYSSYSHCKMDTLSMHHILVLQRTPSTDSTLRQLLVRSSNSQFLRLQYLKIFRQRNFQASSLVFVGGSRVPRGELISCSSGCIFSSRNNRPAEALPKQLLHCERGSPPTPNAASFSLHILHRFWNARQACQLQGRHGPAAVLQYLECNLYTIFYHSILPSKNFEDGDVKLDTEQLLGPSEIQRMDWERPW